MNLTKMLLVLLALMLSDPSISLADSPASFRDAKKVTASVHQGFKTFYCGCEFNGKKVDLDSCGYKARKQPKRASRVEWEHIVSAWELGHQRQCWQTGGRKNCKRNDQYYNRMAGDLINLVPSSGEPNGDRSNFRFGMLEGEPRAYGKCDFEVDFKLRRAEPTESVRGDIARTYFYMRDRYGLQISRQQNQLYNAWDRMDPVSRNEKIRNDRILDVQGQGNCFVSKDCTIEKLPGSEQGQQISLRKPVAAKTPSFSGIPDQCSPQKRYCKHMTSCEQARFYLNQCGRTRLDGDGDGNPCESLCR